jgi:hypothetical protein
MPAIVHIGSASDCGHIFSCHKISAFRKSLKDGVYRTDTKHFYLGYAQKHLQEEFPNTV